jgi:hypothetical protein
MILIGEGRGEEVKKTLVAGWLDARCLMLDA